MLSRKELIDICAQYLDKNGYYGEYYLDIVSVTMPEDRDGYDEVTNESNREYYEKRKKAVVTFRTIFHDSNDPAHEMRAPNFVLFINYETGEVDGPPPEL